MRDIGNKSAAQWAALIRIKTQAADQWHGGYGA
jgi:hypothetical protein